MKKGLRIISGLAATLMLSQSLTNIAFAAGEILNIDDMNVKVNEKYVIGDLDFSGIIDLTDMSIISLYLIGEINLEDIQKVSADINMDGKLCYRPPIMSSNRHCILSRRQQFCQGKCTRFWKVSPATAAQTRNAHGKTNAINPSFGHAVTKNRKRHRSDSNFGMMPSVFLSIKMI